MSASRPNRPVGKGGHLHPKWRSITVKVDGATIPVKPWSLMKLKEDVNPLFPAGTIVALSNELFEDYSTPTKYEGQGSPNANTSARVRVYLWKQVTTVTPILSRDGGKPFSIQHKHLIDPITKSRKALGSWDLSNQVKLSIPPADGSVTYMTEKYPAENDPNGVSFYLPNGIVGVVSKCMTGTNREITAAQMRSSKRTDWWYVIKVNVQKTEWIWVPCRDFVSILVLTPLRPEEATYMEELISRTSGPALLTLLSKTS